MLRGGVGGERLLELVFLRRSIRTTHEYKRLAKPADRQTGFWIGISPTAELGDSPQYWWLQ